MLCKCGHAEPHHANGKSCLFTEARGLGVLLCNCGRFRSDDKRNKERAKKRKKYTFKVIPQRNRLLSIEG